MLDPRRERPFDECPDYFGGHGQKMHSSYSLPCIIMVARTRTKGNMKRNFPFNTLVGVSLSERGFLYYYDEDDGLGGKYWVTKHTRTWGEFSVGTINKEELKDIDCGLQKEETSLLTINEIKVRKRKNRSGTGKKKKRKGEG